MSSRRTGVRTGRPAHAARPGVPPRKAVAIAAGAAAIGAALWVGGAALLKAGGSTATTPVSAKSMTVTPTVPVTTGAARP